MRVQITKRMEQKGRRVTPQGHAEVVWFKLWICFTGAFRGNPSRQPPPSALLTMILNEAFRFRWTLEETLEVVGTKLLSQLRRNL